MDEIIKLYEYVPKWIIDQKPNIYICPSKYKEVTDKEYKGLPIIKKAEMPYGGVVIGFI